MPLLLYFLFAAISTISAELSPNIFKSIDNFLNLTTSIQNFYNAKSICILYSSSIDNLQTTTTILKVIRRLSGLNTRSQALHLSELNSKYPSDTSRYSRQLFVLHIRDETGIANFANFSQSSGLALHAWLALTTSEACEEPGTWRLRLECNTRLLVKCSDNEVISEWYRFTKTGRIHTRELAKWSPERGLSVLDKRNMILRRQNFEGGELRIASVKNYNYPLDSQKKRIYLTSFQIVMKIIMKQMNVTPISLPDEDLYGLFNESTKRWAYGILGKLESGEIDVAVAGLILTRDRLDYFDMTHPIEETRVRIFIREPQYPIVQWSAYLKVFNRATWFTIAIIILISSILLYFMKMQIKEKYSWRNVMLFENFLYVWGIYCQQGLSDRTYSPTLRVAYISLFCSSLVITACYTASLYTNLAFFVPQLPFNSLEEFVNGNSYKLIALRNRLEYHLLSPPMSNKLKKLAKSHNEMPYYYEEAFQQVCNEKTAFYTTAKMRTVFFTKDVPCPVLEILIGSRMYVSVALVKGNPLTKFIDFYIRKLLENGILRHIRNSNVSTHVNYQMPGFKTVSLWEISPLMIILLIGCVLSIIVLIIEHLLYKLSSKKWKIKP